MRSYPVKEYPNEIQYRVPFWGVGPLRKAKSRGEDITLKGSGSKNVYSSEGITSVDSNKMWDGTMQIVDFWLGDSKKENNTPHVLIAFEINDSKKRKTFKSNNPINSNNTYGNSDSNFFTTNPIHSVIQSQERNYVNSNSNLNSGYEPSSPFNSMQNAPIYFDVLKEFTTTGSDPEFHDFHEKFQTLEEKVNETSYSHEEQINQLFSQSHKTDHRVDMLEDQIKNLNILAQNSPPPNSRLLLPSGSPNQTPPQISQQMGPNISIRDEVLRALRALQREKQESLSGDIQKQIRKDRKDAKVDLPLSSREVNAQLSDLMKENIVRSRKENNYAYYQLT